MKGKVTNITDYGVFVQLEPGIEGLVHVSELSWTRQNVSPRKFVELDQEVEFMVLDIDVEKHRISLGIKQCTDNVWQSLSEKYSVGTVIEGTVENVADFGVFVDFGENVSALVHANDLSWVGNPEKLLKNYKKGDKVKAVVLSVDAEKERVNAGMKQLEKDPFEEAFQDLRKGSVVTCTVKAIEKDGILVEVTNGINSFIKKADLSNDKVEQRPDRFAIEDRLDTKVVSLDKVNRTVVLSIKALEADEQKQKIAEYGSASSGASLGDILGKAMNKVEEKKKD